MFFAPARSARVDDFSADAGHANVGAAVELLAADAGRLVGARAEQHHVRNVDRRLLLEDAARLVAARLAVTLHHRDALDDELVDFAIDANDLARLSLVLAGDHDD